jgi:hypothetical protein
MRAILLMALAACGSGTKSSADAYVSPQQCEATFESSVDRACTTPADCALVTHPDCCGDVEIGVNKAMLAAAMSLETSYSSCENASCGARGCQHATMAEDGMVPMTGQSIVVVCTSQACSSTVQ